jgi:pyruvate/2-oxoglutarate dehydrogenase complex dihydrolipoamide dehydrogenase (E3) component
VQEESVKYDSIVIGSGQGGNPIAQQLSSRGEKVALIESGPLGGTCVNTGCTPTKTMVASAQVAYYARNGNRWGVNTTGISLDMPKVLSRARETVMSSRTSWEKKVNQPGKPDLIHGRARFVAHKRIQVDSAVFEAERIFLDTGGRPTIPRIEGLSETPYLTNVQMVELREVPGELLVLGGGYIGLEFGQMFQRFGSQVTIIHTGKHILPNEDEDITEEMQRVMEGEGIKFVLQANVTNAAAVNGRIRLTLADGSALTGSHLLIATGRTPNTQDLDLERTGVKTNEKGFIVVNDRLETTADGIWALGDVTGGPAFTHISYNDFQIVAGNLFEGKNLSTKGRIVPYGVFTDPPLGRVGLSEKAARQQGRKIKVGKIPMNYVARARERGETSGLMKIIVDAETDRVLGACLLGIEGPEIVQILGTLMLADKPYTLLKGAIYIHPTLAEGLFGLMDSVAPVD